MANARPIHSPFDETLGVRSGFFGRLHGASAGIYESLNCGFGSSDDPLDVMENRKRVARWFGLKPRRLMTVFQTHSTKVHVVRAPWRDDPPEGDALVTNRPNLAIGVLTADCGPILFSDPVARVIGAAHAGWRGALGGVVENIIAAMCELGAQRDNIRAAVGPLIGAASYEVGPEFESQFLEQNVENSRFFEPGRRDKLLFDLAGYIDARLYAAGVRHIQHSRIDSFYSELLCFSHRRSRKLSEMDYGRQISAIALLR